jgi:hypothetical protein
MKIKIETEIDILDKNPKYCDSSCKFLQEELPQSLTSSHWNDDEDDEDEEYDYDTDDYIQTCDLFGMDLNRGMGRYNSCAKRCHQCLTLGKVEIPKKNYGENPFVKKKEKGKEKEEKNKPPNPKRFLEI